ncbi:hypothetical protein AVEN_150661-1, partial [Araneus ventricosus]
LNPNDPSVVVLPAHSTGARAKEAMCLECPYSRSGLECRAPPNFPKTCTNMNLGRVGQ